MASLTVETGLQTGEEVVIDRDKVTFGRSPNCNYVIKHQTVSREHFYVEKNNGKIFLVDQNSENGTFANNERVSWVELKDGDKIRAGPFSFVFRMDTEGSESSQPAAEQPDRHDPSAYLDLITAGLYPAEYLEGIDLFNASKYFDAHEVWEEVWLRSSGDTKLFYQMLIQAAVGLHHFERGNDRGARGMYGNVVDKLQKLPSTFMSLDLVDFGRQFSNFLEPVVETNNNVQPPALRPRIRLIEYHSGEWNL